MNEETKSGLIQDVRDLDPVVLLALPTDESGPAKYAADSDGTDTQDDDGTDSGDADGTDNADADGTDGDEDDEEGDGDAEDAEDGDGSDNA